jgi:hypothetical protein
MPPQLVINVQSSYAVHNSSTAAACCYLPVVSLELCKNQTHFISHLDSELCGYASSTTSGLPLREVVLILFIYVFKEIRSYFYSRVQGNYVIFIYNCSKKLGPIYIHVFKEIRSYAYALVQLL